MEDIYYGPLKNDRNNESHHESSQQRLGYNLIISLVNNDYDIISS